MPAYPVDSQIDKQQELDAIRGRLTQRRQQLYPGNSAGAYNSTDLADAEWMLVELDGAFGHECCLTPSEAADLLELTGRRKLAPQYQAVLDRISGKHDDLTPAELVELDWLHIQQDALLGPVDAARYKDLAEKDKGHRENRSRQPSDHHSGIRHGPAVPVRSAAEAQQREPVVTPTPPVSPPKP